MDDRKPNGNQWDEVDGSDPEPYVIVDGHSYRDDRCKDTKTCAFKVVEKGRLAITVKDADLGDDDDAGSTTCDAGESCRTKGATVIVVD